MQQSTSWKTNSRAGTDKLPAFYRTWNAIAFLQQPLHSARRRRYISISSFYVHLHFPSGSFLWHFLTKCLCPFHTCIIRPAYFILLIWLSQQYWVMWINYRTLHYPISSSLWSLPPFMFPLSSKFPTLRTPMWESNIFASTWFSFLRRNLYVSNKGVARTPTKHTSSLSFTARYGTVLSLQAARAGDRPPCIRGRKILWRCDQSLFPSAKVCLWISRCGNVVLLVTFNVTTFTVQYLSSWLVSYNSCSKLLGWNYRISRQLHLHLPTILSCATSKNWPNAQSSSSQNLSFRIITFNFSSGTRSKNKSHE